MLSQVHPPTALARVSTRRCSRVAVAAEPLQQIRAPALPDSGSDQRDKGKLKKGNLLKAQKTATSAKTLAASHLKGQPSSAIARLLPCPFSATNTSPRCRRAPFRVIRQTTLPALPFTILPFLQPRADRPTPQRQHLVYHSFITHYQTCNTCCGSCGLRNPPRPTRAISRHPGSPRLPPPASPLYSPAWIVQEASTVGCVILFPQQGFTARLIPHVSAYPWPSGRRHNKVVLVPSQPARWRSQTPTLLHRLPITSSSRPRHSTRPSYTQRSSGRAKGPESLEPLVFGRTSLRARAPTTRSTCTRLLRKRRPRDCTAKQTRRLPCRRQNLVSREPSGSQCSIVAKFTTAEVAAAVGSSLAPLRSIQHRDPLGNPIGRSQTLSQTMAQG